MNMIKHRKSAEMSILLILLLIATAGGSVLASAPQTETGGKILLEPETLLEENHSAVLNVSGRCDQENLKEATLFISRPAGEDLTPYTRKFNDKNLQMSIAWWMAPGFMDNTTEFRRYQRGNDSVKKSYPEEKQVFFNQIEANLDMAMNGSVLTADQILFRGISPGVTGEVMNHSRYIEDAYASTSYDPTVCLDIFSPGDDTGYHNLLVLERKAGEHALYINEDEREILLPRGTKWQVTAAVAVENLLIESDFPLNSRIDQSEALQNVRLIYIIPVGENP